MKRMSENLNSNETDVGNKESPPAEKLSKSDGEIGKDAVCVKTLENADDSKRPSATNPESNGVQGSTKAAVTGTENNSQEMPTSTSIDGDNGATGSDNATASASVIVKEEISFSIVFGNNKHTVTEPLDETVEDLKEKISTLTGVPPNMQKLMFKGLLKDGQTLRDAKVSEGCKIMLIGSTPTQVAAANTAPKPEELCQAEAQAIAKEPLCKQRQHVKALEKGMPDDVMPGIKNARDNLPMAPISGMTNARGLKVRLTFKLELDQVWIGTKERTDKISMSQIKDIVSEPIEGHEEYHIMGLQLGPTEASRYWLYWVPAQYVSAIKSAIIG